METLIKKEEELIPEQDMEFLLEKEYVFEIKSMPKAIHVIFKDFDFPEHYTPRKADLLIILPAGYPNATLDMFRTNPDVKLNNGSWPKAASPHENIDGKSWQAWSRHTTWRVGRDNLRSFITAIKTELGKGI